MASNTGEDDVKFEEVLSKVQVEIAAFGDDVLNIEQKWRALQSQNAQDSVKSLQELRVLVHKLVQHMIKLC